MTRFSSITLLLAIMSGCTAQAPDPATPAPIQLEQVVTGLERPLSLVYPPDGSNRLMLLEQGGLVRILEQGELKPEPFLDITRVISTGNEQGLLGLAFHPDYQKNGLAYVHYTGDKGQTVVAQYHVDATNPDRLDPSTAKEILTVPQPYANHNGGPLMFGPDGYLYLALGDGGSGGDPQNNAQNLESLLGKILRLDVAAADGYRIPPDNPFVEGPGRDEIWAYGLRNPWRASFDRSTGDLYIADVGQSRIEEINYQPKASKGGENYGWRIFEGTSKYKDGDLPNHVPPVYEYTHEATDGCSVTGGYVYRGKALPDLVGTYLFSDYCNGQIWGLRRINDQWQAGELLGTEYNISSFGEDAAGELYVIDHRGTLYRIVPR